MSQLEEELQTTLKTLFAEKKKVRDLEKKLQEVQVRKNDLEQEIEQISLKTPEIDQKTLQEKFFQKLRDSQEPVLKEKDEEIYTLRKQLQVVKPTLKKLVDELKRARSQIAKFDEEKEVSETSFAEISEKLKSALDELEILKEASLKKDQQIALLEEKLSSQMVVDEEKAECKVESSYEQIEQQLLVFKKENENKEYELRQAQQQFAKKIKESTLLRDLLEKQKVHIMDLQGKIDQHKSEVNRLNNQIQLQRIQEEKNQELFNNQVSATEERIQGWQEKYLELQKKWQDSKLHVQEMQKIKAQYEELTSKVFLLKSYLSKSIELFDPKESPQENNALNFED